MFPARVSVVGLRVHLQEHASPMPADDEHLGSKREAIAQGHLHTVRCTMPLLLFGMQFLTLWHNKEGKRLQSHWPDTGGSKVLATTSKEVSSCLGTGGSLVWILSRIWGAVKDPPLAGADLGGLG